MWELNLKGDDMMKYVNAVRFTISWAFYWAGHAVSLSSTIERSWGYRLYNWLMLRSDDVQGKTSYGPWGPVEQMGEGK